MDFTKLKTFMRAQIAALKAYADLTDATWDDEYADRIESVFTSLFGPAVYGSTVASTHAGGSPVEAAITAASLPVWMIPLLLQLGQKLLEKLLSK